MKPQAELRSTAGFDPTALAGPASADTADLAMTRLWYGFMTARATIALALLLLQGTLYALGQPLPVWLLPLCGAYFASTLAMRLLARPRLPRHVLDPMWLFSVGMDVVVIGVLHAMPTASINYTPLFGIPVLLAGVLGSRTMAIGTALAITVLLVVDAWWSAHGNGESTARTMQSLLTGVGYVLVAFLVNQLAARLVREEQLALQGLQAARLQTRVNELVIEALADGVLVVDAAGTSRAANPAARLLLGTGGTQDRSRLSLAAEPGWAPLLELALRTFARESAQEADVTLRSPRGSRRIRVRTRLTETHGLQHESLCVVFLHDLRETEARLRTEKMAAMGRMSAAVAHEIRNPLAAIAQANALLDEDLADPTQRRLTQMIQQNTLRLTRIVEEVLDVARVPTAGRTSPPSLVLDDTVAAVCQEWVQQAPQQRRLQFTPGTQGLPVDFDTEHLRRVLINLLDNAQRYVSTGPAAIQVSTRLSPERRSSLQVWSDGAPLEHSVEQHLFEPFFSSESRSSGLGLYICRELCERHRASIGYQRVVRTVAGDSVQGNEFFVQFRPPKPVAPVAGTDDPTQMQLI